MLADLRKIVLEVNSASSLPEALEIIVDRVKKTMVVQVCSIYLRSEDESEYVLMASDGLLQEAVGSVRLSIDEGLVGLVARREESINLDEAESHPNFAYFPETGEERFASFLGVPIVHQRQVLGVLVVQQRSNRRFDEDEEAFLVTLSAQLAGVIAHAEATGAIQHLGQGSVARFYGVPGAGGIAIGHCHVVSPLADLNSVPYATCTDVEAESSFFRRCLTSVRDDIKSLDEQLGERLSREERVLFEAYLGMLDDAAIGGEVVLRIESGLSAAFAWTEVIKEHLRVFTSMEDPYLRERASDVRDLGSRVLAYLQEKQPLKTDFPDRCILVGDELTASILGEVPRERLVGIVSVKGSSNSHVAIMARSMGIPTVMGAVDLPFIHLNKRTLIVDGYDGVVFSDPHDGLVEYFEERLIEEQLAAARLEEHADLPCETTDGSSISLWVNTGLIADAEMSLSRGAEGVGLFRTEVPFMLRERFPTEEEQRKAYREQLVAFHPHPVTMRTLDIGGDKALPYFPIAEENPFLGWRGIRVTLDHPEIFLAQVRAMLKASVDLENLRIMLPMITNLSELGVARMLIERAFNEIVEEGYQLAMPQIGVMLEVPAAVFQAREYAKRVDFVSVGSNDLTQYLLAVDRNNPRVAELYSALHPSVLLALKIIADECRKESTPISICGELAGDPMASVLLLAMGYDGLSMSATNLLKVKSTVRSVSMTYCRELLARALTEQDEMGVVTMLRAELDLDKLAVNRPAGRRVQAAL